MVDPPPYRQILPTSCTFRCIKPIEKYSKLCKLLDRLSISVRLPRPVGQASSSSIGKQASVAQLDKAPVFGTERDTRPPMKTLDSRGVPVFRDTLFVPSAGVATPVDFRCSHRPGCSECAGLPGANVLVRTAGPTRHGTSSTWSLLTLQVLNPTDPNIVFCSESGKCCGASHTFGVEFVSFLPCRPVHRDERSFRRPALWHSRWFVPVTSHLIRKSREELRSSLSSFGWV